MQTNRVKRLCVNVGGVRYETSVQTLTSTVPDSLLSRMVQEQCSENEVFIDRDGSHFGIILNYLRGVKVDLCIRELSLAQVSLLDQEIRHLLGNDCPLLHLTQERLLINTFAETPSFLNAFSRSQPSLVLQPSQESTLHALDVRATHPDLELSQDKRTVEHQGRYNEFLASLLTRNANSYKSFDWRVSINGLKKGEQLALGVTTLLDMDLDSIPYNVDSYLNIYGFDSVGQVWSLGNCVQKHDSACWFQKQSSILMLRLVDNKELILLEAFNEATVEISRLELPPLTKEQGNYIPVVVLGAPEQSITSLSIAYT